jgi:hypothetical protein
MAFKSKTETLFDQRRQRMSDLMERIARLAESRAAKLLADADAGRVPEAQEIEAQILTLRADLDREREVIAALDQRLADEARAKQAKRQAAHVDRLEEIFNERVKNGVEIEKTIAKLIELVANDIEFSKKIIPAWPWSNSDREILKPFGVGIRQLICYEFYRQSATAFMNNVAESAITLPGSVCEKMELRLQPGKIVPLAARLREIASHASAVMRRAVQAKTEAAEEGHHGRNHQRPAGGAIGARRSARDTKRSRGDRAT